MEYNKTVQFKHQVWRSNGDHPWTLLSYVPCHIGSEVHPTKVWYLSSFFSLHVWRDGDENHWMTRTRGLDQLVETGGWSRVYMFNKVLADLPIGNTLFSLFVLICSELRWQTMHWQGFVQFDSAAQDSCKSVKTIPRISLFRREAFLPMGQTPLTPPPPSTHHGLLGALWHWQTFFQGHSAGKCDYRQRTRLFCFSGAEIVQNTFAVRLDEEFLNVMKSSIHMLSGVSVSWSLTFDSFL